MALRMRAVRVQCVAKPSGKQLKAPIAPRNAAVAGLISGALLAAPARAEEVDAVDATVAAVTEAVKATGSAVRGGLELLGSGARALKQGYEAASPYVKGAVETVAPVVKEAVKVTTDVAAPVVSQAVPAVKDTITGVAKSSGLDLDTVTRTADSAVKVASEGATKAQPLLQKVTSFLAASSPVQLAEYGLGALALYLITPTLLGGVAGGLRGYAGDVTAVQALDAINTGDAVLIDVRTEREKEQGGVPDLPGGGSRLVELELYSVADRKLRGSLRDPAYIEAQITALQIASLKRVGKGSRVILLDRNGSAAKTVARELAKRGFGKVYVVQGGFDGWVRSKLLVKPVAGAALQPLPSIARTVSSRPLSRGVNTASGRKALPAPSK